MKSRTPGWWLGAGLVVCGRCGGPMTVNSYSATKSQAICSLYKRSRSCAGVWINRIRLEMIVGLWLGSRVEEWAGRAERSEPPAAKERGRLDREVARAERDEAKVKAGLARAARMVALGDMDEETYAGARKAAEGRLAEVTSRAEDLRRRRDALDPDDQALAKVAEWMTVTPYGAITRAEEAYDVDAMPDYELPTGAVSVAEWNGTVRKVIRSVVVDTSTVTITPWRGEPAVIDRALHAPRRPKRRAETAHDARGRFTGSGT